MDHREFYKDSFFYAKSKLPKSSVRVLAWKERNGIGYQPMLDVGTDAGTQFLYTKEFFEIYQQCSEQEFAECEVAVAVRLQKEGRRHEVVNYKWTERSFWS